jgi:hypothetical protein
LKGRRRELVGSPADADRDAALAVLDREITDTDLALITSRGQAREADGDLQRAHNRIIAVRNRLREHGLRAAEHEKLVARARQELAHQEGLLAQAIQEAAEVGTALAALLGVDKGGLDSALAALDQAAQGEQVRFIEPNAQPMLRAYPLPTRSVYGGPRGDLHFDAAGNRTTAQGEPLEAGQ